MQLSLSKGDAMFHSTTICCVRRDGKVAMAGDGQVTLGKSIMKGTARKVRRNDRSEMPTAAHTDRSSTDARCSCVWRITAATTSGTCALSAK